MLSRLALLRIQVRKASEPQHLKSQRLQTHVGASAYIVVHLVCH